MLHHLHPQSQTLIHEGKLRAVVVRQLWRCTVGLRRGSFSELKSSKTEEVSKKTRKKKQLESMKKDKNVCTRVQPKDSTRHKYSLASQYRS